MTNRINEMKKSVLITGCSSGIGLTIARALNACGRYQVITTCRRHEDKQSLQNEGLASVLLDLDLPDTIESAVQEILTLTDNRLDILINNAGFGVYGPLITISREAMEKQFSTNFFGVHQLTRKLLPAMISQGGGRIIQISSVMGIISTPGRGAYAASKYALEAWSDALRLEHLHDGIKVSIIEPGPVRTQFTSNVNQTQQHAPVDNPSIAKRFTVTPEAILPKVQHAINSPRPKIRYRVSLMTQGVALLKRMLPDYLMDKILIKK